jgi:cellulose 1,4-beta-cellobiosidase
VGWTVGLGPGTSGQAQSVSLPAAPAIVTAACGTSTRVTITWSAVTGATSYNVYESATSSTTGYTVASSGLTTTSWKSGKLAAGTYWFEVAATAGTGGAWVGANSTAAGPLVITNKCSG